jgi:hypothetical protein
VQVALEDASDEVGRQGGALGEVAQLPDGHDQGGADGLGGDDPVEDPLACLGGLQGPGEEVGEVVDVDAVVAQHLGEGVVLGAGALGPQDVVEEQGVDVAGGEAGEFQAGPVQDGLAQGSDLGVDAEAGHGCFLLIW